jgi:hypothetical protein
MSCTYKTNRYKTSVLIIPEQIALHINFYVSFAFMMHEEISDYLWMMLQLRAVYVELKLLVLTIIIIDMKRELINACELFEDVDNLLCLWHINKNVLVRCKPDFISKEAWKIFYLK